MKTIFKNKKISILTIASIAVILAIVIVIPTVFALDDNSSEIIEKQPEENINQEIIQNQADQTIEQEIVTSSNQDIEVGFETIDKTDKNFEVSNPIITNELLEIKNDYIIFSDKSFSLESSKDNSSVFNRPIKAYSTDTFDSIEVDGDNNTVYTIMLSSETAKSFSLKSKSNSEADLMAASDKLASKLCKDVKRYNLCKVQYDEISNNYRVLYSRTINGYYTTEFMSICFDDDLNFCGYYCKPNVFDNVDVSNLDIDEKAIQEQIDKDSLAVRGEIFGHNEIQDMTLTVENSKVIMLVDFIEYKNDGTRLVSNGIARAEIEIK